MIHLKAGRQRQLIGAAIEALPNRTLLSVSVSNQTLTIVGTESGDHITIAADPKFINLADIDINGDLTTAMLGEFRHVEIQGLGGNDRIIIDSSLDPLTSNPDFADGQLSDKVVAGISGDIDGGAGNDTITTGAGNDALIGEAGNDRLNGNAGSDFLQGSGGSDKLNGGNQNDSLIGGAGNDVLSGGNGNDKLSDNAGQDLIHGNAGDDTIKAADSGNLYGDGGNDSITATGKAYVYGGTGYDTLWGSTVWGGDGDDTISGTAMSDSIHGDAGNDSVHGEAGNDLIYGDDGSDQIFGDDDNDALYGGSMSDTIHGGAGDDNLYGDDGAKDKNHADDGNDAGYGDAGTDWFEPTHAWAITDADAGQDSKHQNHLNQDPSYGSGGYTSGSTIQTGGNYTSGSVSSGSWFNPVYAVKSLGQGGLLASGTYDSTTNSILPAALNKADKVSLKPVIMQLPPKWQVGKMLTASGDIVWYRLTGEHVNSDPTPSGPYPNTPIFIPAPAVAPLSLHTEDFNQDGDFDPNGIYAQDIPDTVPGATKGVDTYYRFLAVKRGTILISSPDDPNVLCWNWPNRAVMALPTNGTIWIAGDTNLKTLVDSSKQPSPDSLPDTGHGIFYGDGTLWIPKDGLPTYIED